jgi:biopolymer transport protein ExbD
MPLKTQQEQLPELNLTPMIDVLFLLIIFFMVGTKFAELERNIKLEVPRVDSLSSGTSSAPPKVVVNVYRDGSVLMNDQQLTLEDLRNRLTTDAAQNPSMGVIVRGDAEGPFQHVANVLSVCRTAGIRELGVSVQLDSPRR